MDPPTIFRLDLIATTPQVPILDSAHRSFGNPTGFEQRGVDAQWFQDLPKFCGISVWMNFGFLVDSEYFCEHFCVPEKFLFYMGMIVYTVLSNFEQAQRFDDICEIHLLRQQLCDPKLFSHQNFPLWARPN